LGLGVRATKEKKFLIGISEAQEMPAIEFLATSTPPFRNDVERRSGD
jgi:hypothetical protein